MGEESDLINNFSDNLRKLIEKPPYLVFLFTSSFLLALTIIFDKYFEKILLFFLYSVTGSILRHIIKDIKNFFSSHKKTILIVYHISNIVLILLLLILIL